MFCKLWWLRGSFLESGAWARPRSSSSQANVVMMQFFSQFLTYGIKSKFLWKGNKALHHLVPPHISVFIFCHLCFFLLQYLSSVVSEHMRISRVSALLHIYTYCSLKHSPALLMSGKLLILQVLLPAWLFLQPRSWQGGPVTPPLRLDISPWSQASHFYCLFVCLPSRLQSTGKQEPSLTVPGTESVLQWLLKNGWRTVWLILQSSFKSGFFRCHLTAAVKKEIHLCFFSLSYRIY